MNPSVAPKSICVFCSSSDAVDRVFFEAAEDLGAQLARAGHSLVYGGTNVGLMGALAQAVRRGGGRVVGILPEFFRDKEFAADDTDELVVAADLRERKAAMELRADAFIALPGGFGTLEELAEILVLVQLRRIAKPVVLLNTSGFFDPLLAFFEKLYEDRFAKPESRAAYKVARDPADALRHIDSWTPPVLGEKWFR